MNCCRYCSSQAVSSSNTPMISRDTVSALVADATKLGLRCLAISGGEPFLHPDIRRILAVCAAFCLQRLLRPKVFDRNCALMNVR